MTQEEKAKAYNEALERARSMAVMPTDKAMLEEIFPELRESEDDRMLREFDAYLRDEIEFYTNDCRDEEDRRKLAMLKYMQKWLEKQKEPTKEELYAEAGTTEKEYIANTMKMVRAMREKKQEQKPAESSTNLDEILDDYFANFKVPEHQIIFEDTFRKIAKDFYEMKHNSKPVEWSEEDEQIRDNIICVLQKDVTYTPPTRPNSCTGSGNAFYTHQTEIDWLKSLRPTKQDWSEEDERIRQGLIEMYKNEHLVSVPIGIHSKGIIRFLENLRPSWKPSEEDIKMLEHIIGQYETGNKNSKVMGYLPRVEELSFLKKVLSKWKN